MGQRLVINIYQNGSAEKPLANCYFHWDAYTMSSLKDLKAWIKVYEYLDYIADTRLRVVRAFEFVNEILTPLELIKEEYRKAQIQFGNDYAQRVLDNLTGRAGLEEKSLALMQEAYPREIFGRGMDRNHGLIAVEDSEIEDSRMWGEGFIDVYLDEKVWRFDVYDVMDYDWFHEAFCDEFGIQYDGTRPSWEELKEKPAPFSVRDEFSWEDVDKVIAEFKKEEFYDAEMDAVISRIQ